MYESIYNVTKTFFKLPCTYEELLFDKHSLGFFFFFFKFDNDNNRKGDLNSNSQK